MCVHVCERDRMLACNALCTCHSDKCANIYIIGAHLLARDIATATLQRRERSIHKHAHHTRTHRNWSFREQIKMKPSWKTLRDTISCAGHATRVNTHRNQNSRPSDRLVSISVPVDVNQVELLKAE